MYYIIRFHCKIFHAEINPQKEKRETSAVIQVSGPDWSALLLSSKVYVILLLIKSSPRPK